MDNIKPVTSAQTPKQMTPTAQNPKPAVQENTTITQREAVYIETIKILKQEKITIVAKQPVGPALNEKHMQLLVKNVSAGLKAGSVALKETESNKKKLADPKLLEKYVIGLINNWMRRDERLNGTADKVQ